MPYRFSLACLLAGMLVLAGCDAADPDPATGPDGSALSSDMAAAIAGAVGVASGGALHDLAEVALVLQAIDGRGTDLGPGCERSRTWDPAEMAWIRLVACERGDPDGPFYALFSRTHEFRFFGAGGKPQQLPPGAVEMHVDLVDGQGILLRPRLRHELLDIGASFQVSDYDQRFVTTNGDYHRAATDTLRGLNNARMRTLTYELDLELIDVVGPRHAAANVPPEPTGHGIPNVGRLHRLWAHAVSGTIQGQITGVMTAVTPHGTHTRHFDHGFVLTLGQGGNGHLRFPITNERFLIDLERGAVVASR